MKDMVVLALKFHINDKKFVFDVLSTIEGRIKSLKLGYLVQVLILLCRQPWAGEMLGKNAVSSTPADKQAQKQAIKSVIIVMLKKILEKPLKEQRLSAQELDSLISVIELLDSFDFFQKSQALKIHMMTEIGAALEASKNSGFRTPKMNLGGVFGKVSAKYLDALIKMNLQLPDSSLEGFIYVSSAQFGASSSEIELTLKKLDYLFSLENIILNRKGSITTSNDTSVEQAKIKHQLKSLKTAVLSLHNHLCRPAILKSPRMTLKLMISVLSSLQSIEKNPEHRLPCSPLAKKLALIRLVTNSYELTTEELESATFKILDSVKNGEDTLIRTLQKFAFDEYSELTQLEYRLVSQQADEGYQPQQAGRLRFANFRDVKTGGVSSGTKISLRIQTCLINSLFILGLVGRRNPAVFRSMAFGEALESVRLAADSSYLTQEAWETFEALSGSLDSYLLPNHKPILEEIRKIYQGELTPAFEREQPKNLEPESIDDEDEGQVWTENNAVEPEIDPESTLAQLSQSTSQVLPRNSSSQTRARQRQKPKLDKITQALKNKPE